MTTIHVEYAKFQRTCPQTVSAIDGAFEAVITELKHRGVAVSFDDRAEKLVEAIAAFVSESKPK